MRNKLFLNGVLLVSIFSLGSCYPDCPDTSVLAVLQSGTYSSPPDPPWRVAERAVIDRQAGTATFTFQRNGVQIVETWKLTPRPSQ